MAKQEWGIKRSCQGCNSVFYDMQKTPITCPKCKAEYNEKTLLKRHPLDPSVPLEDQKDYPKIEQENEGEFLPDTPAELLESLEELEDNYEPAQLLKS